MTVGVGVRVSVCVGVSVGVGVGVWVDVEGNGSYPPFNQVSEGFERLDVPCFDVIGGEADHFSAVVRQPARPGGPSRLVICSRDKYGNRQTGQSRQRRTKQDLLIRIEANPMQYVLQPR